MPSSYTDNIVPNTEPVKHELQKKAQLSGAIAGVISIQSRQPVRHLSARLVEDLDHLVTANPLHDAP